MNIGWFTAITLIITFCMIDMFDTIGTLYGTRAKGPRYLEMAEGYITKLALDEDGEIIGYEFVNLGKMMEAVKKGVDANEALESAKSHYGQWDSAAKYIDPRQE